MTTFNKKIAKGLPVGIKVRKPRYYYQDITATYNTSATKNIDLVEFEGLDYNLNRSTLVFNNKKLWNNENYIGSTRALAPLYKDIFVKYGGYSVIGSLTNDNNVFSGFSESNYLSLNSSFEVGDNTWEVVAKFTTTESFPNLQGIYHFHNAYSDNGRYGLIIRMQGNKFNFVASSGYSWLFNSTGSYTIQPNTTYWVKASFDGSKYVLSYSLDGKTYINDIVYNGTNTLLGNLNIMVAGVWYSGSSYIEPLLGKLDLNECYMKIDNNLVWLPEVTEENRQTTPEYLTINKGFIYDVVGNPTLTDGILTGLNSINYIKIPSINLGAKDWEVSLKATTPSDVATNEYSIWDYVDDYTFIRIGSAATALGRWQLLIRVNNSWIDASSQTGSHVIQPNTTYWIKAGFKSSTNTYYLKYSLDGIDYIDDVSYTSSTITPHTSGSSISKSWSGEVYLDECKVTVNGVEVWGKNAKNVISVAGCLDEGLSENYNETTYNAFVKDGNVLLTDKENVEGMIWANTVTVPEHLKSAIYRKNYNVVGTLTYDEIFNVSDFGSNNYILSPSVITEPENNTYLLVTRVTTGDDSDSRNIFWTNSSPDYGCGTASRNQWRIWRGGDTQHAGSFEYNTSYWVAMMQYPDQTILYYMKDDGTFKDISELPLPIIRGGGTQPYWSTGPIVNAIVYGTDVIRIGNGYASTNEYWKGNIDLVNTIIYKNYNNLMEKAEIIWQPLIIVSESDKLPDKEWM